MAGNRELLQKKNRIVVKVGSSTLTHETGKLNYHRIERLAMEIADLANQGKEMVLVSSGAVSAGMGPLGLSSRPKTIREKQAVAAVGQGVLMHTYEKMFREYGQNVGQVLLTRMDAQDRKKFMNSRNTLLTMLQMGVIPIINENDVVAIDEFKIGDNDTLSSRFAYHPLRRRWLVYGQSADPSRGPHHSRRDGGGQARLRHCRRSRLVYRHGRHVHEDTGRVHRYLVRR